MSRNANRPIDFRLRPAYSNSAMKYLLSITQTHENTNGNREVAIFVEKKTWGIRKA